MDGEEENCQGKCGKIEERNIWYLVRCIYSQGTVAHYIQDMVSMHDLVNF